MRDVKIDVFHNLLGSFDVSRLNSIHPRCFRCVSVWTLRMVDHIKWYTHYPVWVGVGSNIEN